LRGKSPSFIVWHNDFDRNTRNLFAKVWGNTMRIYDELAVDDDDEAATILEAFAANQKV
jgi:hypothetical protein